MRALTRPVVSPPISTVMPLILLAMCHLLRGVKTVGMKKARLSRARGKAPIMWIDAILLFDSVVKT